jgi:hypothetical protein
MIGVHRLHRTGEHRNLTGAGWSYRTNDRGWIIYRDPQSGRWHTLQEALRIWQLRRGAQHA